MNITVDVPGNFFRFAAKHSTSATIQLLSFNGQKRTVVRDKKVQMKDDINVFIH